MSIRNQATGGRSVNLLLRLDDDGHPATEKTRGPMPAWELSAIRLALLHLDYADGNHSAIWHVKRFRNHLLRM